MASVNHNFVSAKLEQTDVTLVGPNEWNAAHVAVGAVNAVITTDGSGNLNYDNTFTYSGGVLTVATRMSVPLLVGGSAAGSVLSLESTTGVGTSDLIKFLTGSQVEAMRVDTKQGVVIGGTANLLSDQVEVHNLSATPYNANISVVGWNAIPHFNIYRSNGVTIGVHGALAINNNVGGLAYKGDDGTNFQTAVQLQAQVDGAVSAGVVPGRVLVQTANASGVVTEALRADSSQLITLGGVANQTGVALEVNGTTNNQNTLAVVSWGATSNPRINCARSMSGTIGVHSAVTAGNNILQLRSLGSDGTQFVSGGGLTVTPDANWSVGNTPTRLTLSTNNTASSGPIEAIRVNPNQSVMMSLGALATNATDGFFYMNSCAGAPTGVPTAAPGAAAAMVIDTTNSKIWVRIGGAWKGVVVS